MLPSRMKRARYLQSNTENLPPNAPTYDPGRCLCIGVNTLMNQVFSVGATRNVGKTSLPANAGFRRPEDLAPGLPCRSAHGVKPATVSAASSCCMRTGVFCVLSRIRLPQWPSRRSPP